MIDEEYEQLRRGTPLELGDVIICETSLGCKYKFLVTRLTKTIAFGQLEGRNDGYEYKFQRVVELDMSKPLQEWNRTSYKVFRKVRSC